MAKKIIVNGYAYSWRDLRHRLDRVRIRLPQAMADAARNFFVDSFRTMDILTPHDGVTNNKIAKAQIEAVERKQNEYKLIGQMVRVPGHTLY